MKFEFALTTRSYAIEIDGDQFLDLLDSESYVTDQAAFRTGAKTLNDKLNKLDGVSQVEYNGHFGSAIYLTIEDAKDTVKLKTAIARVIEKHLKWCSTLTKAPHVVERRRAA